MRWLDVAWAELGEQEVSGREANPKIIGYFKDAGRADITSDEVAWCGAFAGMALERAGVAIDAIPAAERLLANSYLKIGTPIDEPRVGAICVLSRGSDPSQGHVGFVVGWTEADVVLLGGNQANKVSTAHFPRTRIRGLRWPAEVTARDLDKAGSRITQAARSTQKATAIEVMLEASKHAIEAAPAAPVSTVSDAGAQFAAFLAGRWPAVAIALQIYVAIGMIYRSGLIRGFRAEDASTGKTAAIGGPS